MQSFRRLACFIILVLSFSACSEKRAAITAQDLQIARQAMPITEVSLMLRSGYKEQAIIAEVSRRRVPEKPDAKTEDSLLRSGASPALVQALKSSVLTENQKKAYAEFLAEKENRAAQERSAKQNEIVAQQRAENDDRQRKQQLAQQSIQIARNAEQRVEAYDKADRAYKAQRESLKNQIAFQEAYINQRRGRGANESQLLEDNEKLNRYKEQLRELKEPMR